MNDEQVNKIEEKIAYFEYECTCKNDPYEWTEDLCCGRCRACEELADFVEENIEYFEAGAVLANPLTTNGIRR